MEEALFENVFDKTTRIPPEHLSSFVLGLLRDYQEKGVSNDRILDALSELNGDIMSVMAGMLVADGTLEELR